MATANKCLNVSERNLRGNFVAYKWPGLTLLFRPKLQGLYLNHLLQTLWLAERQRNYDLALWYCLL